MNDQKARYIVLRDGRVWDDAIASLLEQADDGALRLAALPALAAGQEVDLDGPYDAPPSGLAVDSLGNLYVTDTTNQRVVRLDRVCKTRAILPGFSGPNSAPGHFSDPCGLLICSPGKLYVADSGNQRIQVFRLPTLEVQAIWEGQLSSPTGLACDSKDRIYALDRGLKRALRFDSRGVADSAYNAKMSSHAELQSPAFLTIDGDDALFVSDDATDAVLKFDPDGNLLGVIQAPGAQPALRPRALAVSGDRLYVADSAGGRIHVFMRSGGLYLGAALGFRGPVAAMIVADSDRLYVKPGMDEQVITIPLDGGYVSSGELSAGPFDAGDQSKWLRVSASARVTPGGNARLQIFASDDESASPADADWIDAASLDTLLPNSSSPDDAKPNALRYLWLRLILTSDEGRESPRLAQIQAETAGESYMEYLPAIYDLETERSGFLRRWLELFRSELGDIEWMVEDMPRRFDHELAPADQLEWLASWIAFDLPHALTVEQKRLLIGRARELYKSRGTPFGVREFVAIYAGARPHIIESFKERRLWQLDHSSLLGFDTALAPLSPSGMIVPDSEQLANSNPLWGCDEPNRLVVGQAVVGESGPLAAQDFGETLFSETAHRFTVMLPATEARDLRQRQAVKEIIEAEKPAHTDYHLCFIEPRMRVGFQATVGVDTIIAGPPDPMSLEGSTLGLDTALGIDESDEGNARIGKRARVGRNTVLR